MVVASCSSSPGPSRHTYSFFIIQASTYFRVNPTKDICFFGRSMGFHVNECLLMRSIRLPLLPIAACCD